ncbi:SpoVR family protein [Sulfobacillus thermosulfidooxidans]|uniref:SpoVR family protein n=1 Tax=Sulfobacillus thermosulfidooxidans TaxID=28034 RepID=UPI0006B5F277|nr:SpoVR family protein [Sulfobacillus thermosulfidooxidans]
MPRSYPTDEDIEDLARSAGLDPLPVCFEDVPPSILYEYAAYWLPGRFSHWSFGKQYQLLKTSYEYGFSKIYELVLDTFPAYAFVLAHNSPLENILVHCHVMGHADFFGNNFLFQSDKKHLLMMVRAHARRIRHYEYLYGIDVVERFLDAVLSIAEHVAYFMPGLASARLESSPGCASFLRHVIQHHDSDPEDILGFISRHSPVLKDWQRDIASMIAMEMTYFWPHRRTKIINEGWAVLWHEYLIQHMDLDEADYWDFARLHAQILSPRGNQINPYALGYAIFQRIVRTQGVQEAFVVRQIHDDVSLIRNYLTPDIAQGLGLFVYEKEQGIAREIGRDFKDIRRYLLQRLTHGGIPVIHVRDGDFHHRGELYLVHQHDGQDLDLLYAERTLAYVYELWGRPIFLETLHEGRRMILQYDGMVNTRLMS